MFIRVSTETLVYNLKEVVYMDLHLNDSDLLSRRIRLMGFYDEMGRREGTYRTLSYSRQ